MYIWFLHFMKKMELVYFELLFASPLFFLNYIEKCFLIFWFLTYNATESVIQCEIRLHLFSLSFFFTLPCILVTIPYLTDFDPIFIHVRHNSSFSVKFFDVDHCSVIGKPSLLSYPQTCPLTLVCRTFFRALKKKRIYFLSKISSITPINFNSFPIIRENFAVDKVLK